MLGGEVTIADGALRPWACALDAGYDAAEALALDRYAEIGRWLEACLSRPASPAALKIPSNPF